MNSNSSLKSVIKPTFILSLLLWNLICFGQSLNLTESIQYVNIGDLDISGSSITVEAKILLTNPTGNIVSKHTDPSNVNYLLRPTTFEITTNNGFYLMQNPFTLELNRWYHVAGTYDGQYIRYYVNGCLVIENPASGQLFQNNLDVGIGNRSLNFQDVEQFYGQIDEVRIWNVCRSENEIKASMNNLPNPESYNGLMAYYKFDNDLLNLASNTNNGVPVGSIQFAPESSEINTFEYLGYNILNSNCDNYDIEILASGSDLEYSLDGSNYVLNNLLSLNPGQQTVWLRTQEGCVITTDINLPLEISPTFTQVADICYGDTLTALPTTSNNGITGTWSPALNNTATTTYTFTPDVDSCASTATMTITVNPNIIPTFTQVAAICNGELLNPLPTTSNNGVTGIWSPDLNNTATTTYTFTPDAGQCATTATMTITVNPNPLAPIGNATQVFCSNSEPTVTNLVATGTSIQWYDSLTDGNLLSNTTSLVDGSTYYATQTINNCESTERLAVTVYFNDLQITASATTVCVGTEITLSASTSSSPITNNCNLPVNLQNGLVGYWPFCGNANDVSGNENNGTVNGATLTTDRFGNPNNAYNFDGVSNYIESNRIHLNTFTASVWIKLNTSNCFSAILDAYPSSWEFLSDCISGTNLSTAIWNNPTTYEIYQSNYIIPQNVWINAVMSYGNNILNIYSEGNLVFTGTTTAPPAINGLLYFGRSRSGADSFFNGDLDDIAIWNKILTPEEINQLYTLSMSYLWSTGETSANISVTPTTTSTYWCDVTVNGVTCREEITITVNPNITPTFTQVADICSGDTLTALPTTSDNGYTGTWSPALDNTATTTYTFTPDAGQCATEATITIEVIDCIEICDDGLDNDNDGFVDGFDTDCPCEDNTYFNICEPECELDFIQEPFSITQNWESNSSIIPMTSQVVGDINNDGIQDILALGINGMTISYPRITSDIKIFSGTTGEILTTINTPFTYWSQLGQIAIADIDSDGFAEIFFASSDYGNLPNESRYIFCYNYDGTLKWKSNAQYGDNAPGISKGGGALGIADFNYDGISEVYIYNEIFNAQTGVKLIDGENNGIGHLETSFLNNDNGVFSLSVAADLTSSFGLELAAGKTVYELNLTNLNGLTGNTFNAIQSPIDTDGLTAIADINLDGNLDVVVSSAGNGLDSILYVWNPNNSSLIGSISLPSGHNPIDLVSVPFIGDMDSDGEPEIGLTRPLKLLTYKYNQLNNNLEQFWELQTTDISGLTKLSMFDFNQDGTQELVYRDETQLRIINGSLFNPQTLASFPSTSGTAAEGPIIADINNDNQAEIVIGSENPSTPFVGKLISYKTNSSPWAPARKVWNQYGYFNVNINDDLTVPLQQQNHGLEFYDSLGDCLGATLRPFNSFMAQETIRDTSGCSIYPAPDLTINQISNIDYDCVNETVTFDIEIENQGSTLVATDFNLLFFEGDYSTPGNSIQSQIINTPIQPTGQTIVSISISNINLNNIFALINFNFSNETFPYNTVNECNYLNNYLDILLTPPNITPTFTQVADICSGDTLTALPTTSDNGYTGTWSPALDNTATTTYTFTPDADQCATTTTMTITVNPNITPTFTQVADICSGDTLTALPTTSDNGYTGTWSPALDNTATTTYTFTPDAGQCATTATMTITVFQLPSEPSGPSQQLFCAIDSPTISDLAINSLNVIWYNVPSGGEALNLNTPLTNGMVLYASAYDILTLCESETRFTVQIEVEDPSPPNIQTSVSYCLESGSMISSLPSVGSPINWYDSPFGGSPLPSDHLLMDGEILYGASLSPSTSCESTTRTPLEIEIVDSRLTYYNLLTVDGNGLNESLKIQGIERFQRNRMEIFNRYGNMVWSTINYDNTNNVFKGAANVDGIVSKGSYLPSGTYFFILSYPNDCEFTQLTGFVHLDNKL